MNMDRYKASFSLGVILILASQIAAAQSTLPCELCHAAEKAVWLTGKHANTQADVADELAANWAGQTPDSVIFGSQAEDCVSCHAPLSVTLNGGMTEAQVMGHFFTTSSGVYTGSTTIADSAGWPHVTCLSCHAVMGLHDFYYPPALGIYNSKTATYDSVNTSSVLCGYCHGTLRFADTDHRIYDAWRMSKHGHGGQNDIAGELAANWAGQTPDSVIYGSQAEDCISCHAPTAIHTGHDSTEVSVLQRFFSTSGGKFTSSTTAADSAHWPDMACDACHNPHNPGTISYFNATTRAYQAVASTSELCGQCHGNLRFPDTDHLSYNIEMGTGGIGVPNQLTMPGATCVSCHMVQSDVDGTNSVMYKGHSWSPFVREPDGTLTASCTSCHPDMLPEGARALVDVWKGQFRALDSIAQVRLAVADSVLSTSTDTMKLRLLAQAHDNLDYAESDESGGFHNHNYVMALLSDASSNAYFVVTGVRERSTSGVPTSFVLDQNFPNPFNPTTTIHYSLPKGSHVTLRVFNLLGQEVATLIDEFEPAGFRSVQFNASSLASGIYIYSLQAGEFRAARKLLLIR